MPRKHVTISIVVPVYNEADCLALCLDAIAVQTAMPDEVIIVDNNSTDRSVEIAEQYPFVTVIREDRQGTRYAHRTGMDAASGDIIGRVDADTVLQPDWCKQLRVAFEDPNVAAVSGACFYHDMPLYWLALAGDRFLRSYASKGDGVVLYGSNMAISRRAWQSISPEVCLRSGIFEDCDMSLHLREKNLQILFDADLVAGVAARTLDLSPKQFYRYIRQYDYTFGLHVTNSKTANRAKLIYLTTYPIFKAIRLAYDPDTRRLSILHLLRKQSEPRPSATL